MVDHKQAKKGVFFKMWGDSTDSTRATVVLGAVLVGCLVAGQLLVMGGAGQMRARGNAADLIKQVSQNRLESYLGYYSLENYYILSEQGEDVGFTVEYIEPELTEENKYIYKGKGITYRGPKYLQLQSETSFTVFGDMSRYSYVENMSLMSRFSIAKQDYRNGVLKFTYFTSGINPVGNELTLDQDNFIASFLLDFLSSLAIEEGYKDGVVFSMSAVGPSAGSEQLFNLPECWVKSGGEVPDEVRSKNYNGKSVEVQWLGTDHVQHIYYSSKHQLLWQKDVYTDNPGVESTRKWVSETELYDVFPGAKILLSNWQRGRAEDEGEEM